MTTLANILQATASGSDARLKWLMTCQFNEYAGQANGQGYGPTNGIYVDSYSATLSNDIEPTGLTACGYARPGFACGSFGFHSMNIQTMLNDVTNQLGALDDSLMIAITSPEVGAQTNHSDAAGTSFSVSWLPIGFNSSGITAGHFLTFPSLPVNVSVNGTVVASVPAGITSVTINATALQLDTRFPQWVCVTATPVAPGNDAAHLTRYPLSSTQFDSNVPLSDAAMVPASADVLVWLPLPSQPMHRL